MARVTIADVAKRAHVSPASVSAALNDPGHLNAATVARILATARKLGYAPNPHARALHSRRVGVFGVLFPQSVKSVFANPFFAAFFEGVGSVSDERGIGLLTVSPTDGSLQSAIAAAPVDGFVIVGLAERHREVAPLHKRGVPFVIVDAEAQTASSVNVDDESGAYAAADYLLSRGHRDILVLAFYVPPGERDEAQHSVGGRRLRGYRRAFADHGLRLTEDRLIDTPVTLEGGAEAFGTAWDEGRHPSALLCVSDIMALGALRAARRRGIHVPDDLEVIGFDDIPLAAIAQPSLSTVHQPIVEKGRLATELLIRELDERGPRERIVLPTELILRESTSVVSRPELARAHSKGGSDRGSKRGLVRAARV